MSTTRKETPHPIPRATQPRQLERAQHVGPTSTLLRAALLASLALGPIACSAPEAGPEIRSDPTPLRPHGAEAPTSQPRTAVSVSVSIPPEIESLGIMGQGVIVKPTPAPVATASAAPSASIRPIGSSHVLGRRAPVRTPSPVGP